MKQLTVLALTCVISVSSVNVFAEAPNEGKAQRFEQLSNALDLSASQEQQVMAIMEERHSAMKALHEQTREKMAGVLNAEQMESFEEMRKRKRGKKK